MHLSNGIELGPTPSLNLTPAQTSPVALSAGESGTQYELSQTARQSRSGVNLVIGYDAAAQSFTGTVTNTTTAVVSLVRVEVHLSNGIELGPTPSLNLTPAQTSPVALSADGQQFTTWSVHVEIGEDEH